MRNIQALFQDKKETTTPNARKYLVELKKKREFSSMKDKSFQKQLDKAIADTFEQKKKLMKATDDKFYTSSVFKIKK